MPGKRGVDDEVGVVDVAASTAGGLASSTTTLGVSTETGASCGPVFSLAGTTNNEALAVSERNHPFDKKHPAMTLDLPDDTLAAGGGAMPNMRLPPPPGGAMTREEVHPSRTRWF